MHIDGYSFGKLVVDGRSYSRDVIIFPGRVLSPWWRADGHSLSLDDLEAVTGFAPKRVIIGTGASGLMRVPGATVAALEARGIEVVVTRTADAVEMFNRDESPGGTVAALHLTC